MNIFKIYNECTIYICISIIFLKFYQVFVYLTIHYIENQKSIHDMIHVLTTMSIDYMNIIDHDTEGSSVGA